MKKVISLLCLTVLLLAGCTAIKTEKPDPTDITSLSNDLPNITSMKELKELLGNNNRYNYAMAEDSKDTAASEAASGDYSQTNTQVAGVDEGDIVKTDGQYIYTVGTKGVFIAALGSGGTLEKKAYLTSFDEGFYPTELYIDTQRLVVLGYSYTYGAYKEGVASPALDMEIEPGWWYGGGALQVYVFDKSDMDNIRLSRSLKLDGSYVTSRRTGDYLYIVANQYPYYYDYNDEDSLVLPSYEDSAVGEKKQIAVTDIKYLPSGEYYSFLLLAGISLKDTAEPVDLQTYLGNAGTVYMSQDNIYLASMYWEVQEGPTADPNATEAVEPDSEPAQSGGSAEETATAPDQSVSSASAEEGTVSSDVISVDSYSYKTRIYKFAAKEGKLAYGAAGEVEGTLINQFSMDEYDGYFRIATTTGSAWGGTSANHIFVLDKSLRQVGSVEDLAKGETIYSVRFTGTKGYMVTYRTVDPLFVVDLSDPAKPKVEGELKIPGYSTYMHNYDETHIIGFGMDTQETGEGRVTNGGVKMAMFDVSDPADPKELFNVTIGQAGSFSELNYNHKALLFSKEKNLIAFPIMVTGENYKYTDQGLAVYTVDLANGRFTLRGTISHGYGAQYDYNGYVSRGLFAGDVIYAISADRITAHDINTLQELSSLNIG